MSDGVQTRLFQLLRQRPNTAGVVADGVQWPDGTACIRWRGPHASVAVYSSVPDVAQDVCRYNVPGDSIRLVWDPVRNRLARQAADLADELATAQRATEEARARLAVRTTETDVQAFWLELIAEHGCRNYSTASAGACTRDVTRQAIASRDSDRWCGPCCAWAALHDVHLGALPEKG